MMEKDINIEDGETLNEAPVDEQEEVAAAKDAEAEETEKETEEAEEKDPLELAQDEIKELKTQLLYKAAEFDNYRKRTLKERAELILNGGEKVLTAILPVVDDMERAIENGQKTDDTQVLREGMELIYNKLLKVLENQGVSTIETENADFDTDVHEAVAMVPGMGDDKKGKCIDCVQTGYTLNGKVIDCLQKGYKLNDKVIRHAKVAVGQ